MQTNLLDIFRSHLFDTRFFPCQLVIQTRDPIRELFKCINVNIRTRAKQFNNSRRRQKTQFISLIFSDQNRSRKKTRRKNPFLFQFIFCISL